MGADVIRVETAKRPCVTRAIPPFADDVAGPNRAGYFNQYNQGKRSITLNLSNPKGVEIARSLARHSDVVTENFAAGVMDRMGLGYEKLREYRPDLIMIAMSGYGQTGPYRSYIGYGPPAAALAGFCSVTGYEGLGPSEIGVSFADPNAGIFGAFAIMAALVYRKQTGQGQYIDQSQFETAVALMPEGVLEYAMNGRSPERAGNHDRSLSPHNCYKTTGDDNKWVSIAVGNETEWQALCRVIGQPGLANDPRFKSPELRKQNEQALDEIITAWTRERDRWEITELLQKAGVAAFPSMSNKDLATDEHLLARGYLVQKEHPEVGRRIHAGIPWTMSGTACEVRGAAPLRGADTESVLSELLGYDAKEIERLRSEDILT
jgi:crotonobetainyl-CoA:carnitine CoA-transferase CaiB-like acyl-CoA transferase